MYVLSLHNKKMDNPLILQLLEKLHYLSGAHVQNYSFVLDS